LHISRPLFEIKKKHCAVTFDKNHCNRLNQLFGSQGRSKMSHFIDEKSQFEAQIIIKGKGGHSSEPYKTQNSILIGFEIINAINTNVAYRFNSFEDFTLVPTAFEAGTKQNIIPEETRVQYKGISDNSTTEEILKNLISTTAEIISGIHNATVKISFQNV